MAEGRGSAPGDDPDRFEWITPTEAARRLVAEGVVATMSRQRITQLADGGDPEFPWPRERWRTLHQLRLLPWEPVRGYFERREPKQGTPGHRTPPGPGVTVVLVRHAGPGRGPSRFRSPQEPRLTGVTRWVAHGRYSAETEPGAGDAQILAEAALPQGAIRKIAKTLGVRVEAIRYEDGDAQAPEA